LRCSVPCWDFRWLGTSKIVVVVVGIQQDTFTGTAYRKMESMWRERRKEKEKEKETIL